MWPIAMMDHGVISIAKTGSGKTLAFLLPCYKNMDAKFGGCNGSINVLVLPPTRELATQVQEEADKQLDTCLLVSMEEQESKVFMKT